MYEEIPRKILIMLRAVCQLNSELNEVDYSEAILSLRCTAGTDFDAAEISLCAEGIDVVLWDIYYDDDLEDIKDDDEAVKFLKKELIESALKELKDTSEQVRVLTDHFRKEE